MYCEIETQDPQYPAKKAITGDRVLVKLKVVGGLQHVLRTLDEMITAFAERYANGRRARIESARDSERLMWEMGDMPDLTPYISERGRGRAPQTLSATASKKGGKGKQGAV